MNTRSHYDVAIIGAGLSGLAAGIRLAHFGKRVCIFERHNAPGGLNSFYSLGGRKFDVGLHAVTNYVPPGVKGTPLGTAAAPAAAGPGASSALCEQKQSRVAFGPRGETCAALHQRFCRPRIRGGAALSRARSDGFRRLAQLIRATGFTAEAAAAFGPRRRPGAPGRPAARGHAALPAPLLRQRPRARHGLRPVRHALPGDLPRGPRPAVRAASARSCACSSTSTGAPAANAG